MSLGLGEWDLPAPFVVPFTVVEADIDGLNHVNNAVYVQWCEQAAWAHSAHLGLGLADYRALDRAMAIHRGEYSYQMPGLLGDSLLLATWLTGSDGKLNMRRQFQLRRGAETLLRASWQLVCIEMSSGRPKRMPPLFLATYEPAVIATSE